MVNTIGYVHLTESCKVEAVATGSDCKTVTVAGKEYTAPLVCSLVPGDDVDRFKPTKSSVQTAPAFLKLADHFIANPPSKCLECQAIGAKNGQGCQLACSDMVDVTSFPFPVFKDSFVQTVTA
jgi:hypothetical protein